MEISGKVAGKIRFFPRVGDSRTIGAEEWPTILRENN